MICFCFVTGTTGFSSINYIESSDGEDNSYSRTGRSGFNVLRLDRGLQMLRLGKRGLPMLRLGRLIGDSMSEKDIRYILSLVKNVRQVPLPRYGKDLAFEYMLMGALPNAEFVNVEPKLGFGYDIALASERPIRPAPRYRRSADIPTDNYEKDTYKDNQRLQGDSKALNKYEGERVAPLMRYGKNEQEKNEDENDKRAMNMLRMGRGMRMLRLGKRPDDGDMSDVEKRVLHVLRLGKRPFHMLRLGRDVKEDDKRELQILRLGKQLES